MKYLEYQEVFKKTELKEDIEHVIKAVKEVHNEYSGWEIGEPMIIPIDEKSVQIQIPLKKYSKERTRCF